VENDRLKNRERAMPTKNPRINIVLDDTLFLGIQSLARKENVSLSAKARDLIREALDIQEDIGLARIADDREVSWDEDKAVSHDDLWR